MKILYISERPPYPFFLGGAARCAHEIMHTLVTSTAAECVAIGSANFSSPPWSFPNVEDYKALGIFTVENIDSEGEIDCGYPVKVISEFRKGLNDFIDLYQPDVVWAQMEGAPLAIETAYKKGVHSLLFVHDAEFDVQELKYVSTMTSGIVCSSTFLADKVNRAIKRKAQVVYPCPKVDFNIKGDPNGYITMVNPHRVKGLEILLEIARNMPSERFLLVESWKLTKEALENLHTQLQEIPNITFVRRVSDMGQIYKKTKLLLAPSIWEEGFGMVAVEAQSCGIPVIASARGGLIEAVGNGGILINDYQNPELWIKEITQLLKDKRTYTTLSERAFKHSHQVTFSTSNSALSFLEYCQALIVNDGSLNQEISIALRFTSFFRRLFRI